MQKSCNIQEDFYEVKTHQKTKNKNTMSKDTTITHYRKHFFMLFFLVYWNAVLF